MQGAGVYRCKPNIGHNSNSTLGGVELTWSGDRVGLKWRSSWELSWSLAIFPYTVSFAQCSLAHDLLDVGDEDPDLVCVDLGVCVLILRLVTRVREEHWEGQQGGVLETHSGALD